MNDDSALRLRLRPFWEAVDAGALLLRGWALPALALGVLPQALLALVMGWWLGTDLPWAAVAVLWWLRPVGDRLLLAWAGLRFFQPDGGVRGLGRALKKSFDASFWADLTWRRFSPAAVFLAPLSFLENNKNPKRRAWLVKDQSGGLVLLAVCCALAEGALAYSLWATLTTMLSPGLWGAKAGWNGYPIGGMWVVLYSCGQLLVQPLYVFSCFSLYIAARTRKEGWDLALAFRSARKALKLGVLLLVVGASLFAPAASQAASYQPPSPSDADSETAKSWEKVMSGREYGHWDNGWTLRAKETKPDTQQKANFDLNTIPGGAEGLRAVAIGLGAIVFVTFIVLGARTMVGRGKKNQGPAPVKSQDSSWRDEVLSLWDQGRSREALARLYAAALKLAERRGLSVPEAATEEQCLRVVGADPGFGAAVSGLVRLWSERAWGGIEPSDERFRAAVSTLEVGQ